MVTLMKPQDTTESDPVPADVRAVIDLFATHLAKVTFPEVDAATLRREADEVRTEAANVARARAALDAAVAVCARKTAGLVDTANRAIAYARIYSDAHPERQPLAAAIAAVSSSRSAVREEPKPPGKRRGRPRRQGAELFDAATMPVEQPT